MDVWSVEEERGLFGAEVIKAALLHSCVVAKRRAEARRVNRTAVIYPSLSRREGVEACGGSNPMTVFKGENVYLSQNTKDNLGKIRNCVAAILKNKTGLTIPFQRHSFTLVPIVLFIRNTFHIITLNCYVKTTWNYGFKT